MLQENFKYSHLLSIPYCHISSSFCCGGGLESRSEITFCNILSTARSIPAFFNVAVAVILYCFYTHYNSKVYALVWFTWVTVVLLLSEVVAPLKNVSKIFIIGAAFLAALCSLGTSFSSDFSNDGYGRMLVKMFLLFFCWFILFLKSFLVVQILMERYHYKRTEPGEYRIRECFLICLLINFLVYMPFFLVQYPGVLTGDSVHQMAQILGQESFSNHHPWYYTMLIGLFFKLGRMVFGSANGGIATYTIFSVLFICACCAYVITFLYKKGVKWYWLLLLEIAYAFDPIKAQMSITMWKDIIFSGSVLVLCILLADFQSTVKWRVSIFIIGMLICLTRNNGFLIITCSYALLFVCWKQYRKFLCRAFLPVMLVYLIMTNIVMPYMGVEETETERIKENYCAWKSDAVKGIVRPNEKIIVDNKLEYLKLWMRIGIKNPYCYLKAYIEQTKGYWYHKVDYKVCEEEGADDKTIGMV